MERRFLLQELRNDVWDIWVPPSQPHGLPESADSVDELREAIEKFANRQTWQWWRHFRIVTKDGGRVERWKTKPGRAVKIRRKS